MGELNLTPSQLITLNLKFGGHAKPLKKLAFADVALNALFKINAAADVSHIRKEAAKLCGLPDVEERFIREALSDLQGERKVLNTKKEQWILRPDARKELVAEHKKDNEELEGVLTRHFPNSIARDALREWFLAASASFFGFNSAECIKSISKGDKVTFSKTKTVSQLLAPATKQFRLQKYEAELLAAFTGFIESVDEKDRRYVSSVAFALFSSQLISADTGADPIGLEEIRGATFVLDTNTLFALRLDSSRFASAVDALGKALAQIGAELIYTHDTREEYQRVYAARKNNITALFREYPAEVVAEADDEFVESGVIRGCKTPEDFDRFFGEVLQDVPDQISNGPKITQRDEPALEKELKKGATDEQLKQDIQRKKKQLLPPKLSKKSPASLSHDAALIHAVEYLRQSKQKTWALSADRALRACALDRAGQHGDPTVFMLDGLIQMLAVYSGGPDRKAEDFVPLLTSMMLNRCTPTDRTYTTDDLSWLHSVQERVVDFPPEKIKKIANLVMRNRLSGVDERKLELIVNRAFQEEKRVYEEELEAERTRARGAEEEARNARSELETTRGTLSIFEKAENKRQQVKKLLWKLLWRIPTALALALVVGWLALKALPKSDADFLPWISGLLTFAGLFVWLCWKPFRDYIDATN